METITPLTADFKLSESPFSDESFDTIFAENDYESLYALADMEEIPNQTPEVVHYHTLMEGDDVLIDFNADQHEAIDLKEIFDELGVEDNEELRSNMLSFSQEDEDVVLHINHPQAADFSVTFLDTSAYTLHVGHHDEIIVA